MIDEMLSAHWHKQRYAPVGANNILMSARWWDNDILMSACQCDAMLQSLNSTMFGVNHAKVQCLVHAGLKHKEIA
jgi:hypothetical protein